MKPSSDSRAVYLRVAAARFAADGYHGTSLAAVARDARVTKQALLHYFGTKKRLYAAVLADLAERLCAAVEAARCVDPAAHLLRYFRDMRSAALRDSEDVRLVIRALLDSNPRARVWPLRPYLDKLTELAGRSRGGQAMSEDEIRARIFQVFGAIQYVAISTPTISGMYGPGTVEAMADLFDGILAEALRAFVGD